MFFKKIYNLGDKFEDVVRSKLSHYPIIYAFIGGAGIIIFWRGVWHTVDTILEYFFVANNTITSASAPQLPWWDGPASILVGVILLLSVGLFVTSFIGNEIIISGLKREKKLVEKTEEEIVDDLDESDQIKLEMHEINSKLKQIEKILKNK